MKEQVNTVLEGDILRELAKIDPVAFQYLNYNTKLMLLSKISIQH